MAIPQFLTEMGKHYMKEKHANAQHSITKIKRSPRRTVSHLLLTLAHAKQHLEHINNHSLQTRRKLVRDACHSVYKSDTCCVLDALVHEEATRRDTTLPVTSSSNFNFWQRLTYLASIVWTSVKLAQLVIFTLCTMGVVSAFMLLLLYMALLIV